MVGGNEKTPNDFLVDWPEREFPRSHHLKTSQLEAWGYLADYDEVTFLKTVELLLAGRGEEVIASSNDFLIVIHDKTSDRLTATLSLSAMFPLFFAKEGRQLFLSPDFGVIFRKLKNPNLNVEGTLDYFLTESGIYSTDTTFIDQIHRLPAGSTLTIQKDLNWRIDEPFSWPDYLNGVDCSPMKPREFGEAVIETLRQVIKKRLRLIEQMPLSCDLSSGFDCDLIAYLLKQEGARFRGHSQFTSLNNHDTDIELVKRFSQKHGIEADFDDVTDLVFFSTAEEMRWNVKYLFPGTHSLAMFLSMGKKRQTLMGGDYVSFTGHGGDEFYHSRRIAENNQEEWRQYFDFARLNIESGAGKFLTAQPLRILGDEVWWKSKRLFSNTIGGAAGHQIYFPIYWHFGEWLINPFDDLAILKLAPRIPLDEEGEPLYKHELYKNRADIFLPEQFRVKLPYHEQAVRYLTLSQPTIEKILADSILGKLDLIEIDNIMRAINGGRLSEYVGDLYLMFGNILRLEVFLQGNGYTV